jgi:hypothetical protein
LRPARDPSSPGLSVPLRLPILSKGSKISLKARGNSPFDGGAQRFMAAAADKEALQRRTGIPTFWIDRSEYEMGVTQTTFSLAAGNRHSCQTSIAPLVAIWRGVRDMAIRNSTCKHFGQSEHQKKERPSIPSTAGMANFGRVSLTSLDQSSAFQPCTMLHRDIGRLLYLVTGNHPLLRGEFGNRHPRPKDVQNEIY